MAKKSTAGKRSLKKPSTMKTITGILFCTCVLVGAPKPKSLRPSSVVLTDKVAIGYSDEMSDVMPLATTLGIDYPVLIQASRSGDLSALRLFVFAGEIMPLDAASAEGYTSDAIATIRHVGDAAFSRALHQQTPQCLKSFKEGLLYQLSDEQPDTPAESALRQEFPISAKIFDAAARATTLMK